MIGRSDLRIHHHHAAVGEFAHSELIGLISYPIVLPQKRGHRNRRKPDRANLTRKTVAKIGLSGAPSTIRTCDLCLRRATLYPAELWVPAALIADGQAGFNDKPAATADLARILAAQKARASCHDAKTG
jgi:hypothetical protein